MRKPTKPKTPQKTYTCSIPIIHIPVGSKCLFTDILKRAKEYKNEHSITDFSKLTFEQLYIEGDFDYDCASFDVYTCAKFVNYNYKSDMQKYKKKMEKYKKKLEEYNND